MSDGIFGNRFLGHRDAAWHAKGIVSQEPLTAEEALVQIGGVYIEKKPHMVTLNGVNTQVGFDLVRSATPDDPTERMFGYTTEKYNVLQPLDFAMIFDEKVNQPVETIGFLGKGERMFLTWKLPSFDVATGDEVQLYGFLPLGFDGKMGASINVVTVRVVCQNTWRAAIMEAENSKVAGRGVIWTGRHTSPNLVRDLGAWMEHVQSRAEQQTNMLRSFFGKLVATPLTDGDVYSALFKVYPDPAKVGDVPNSLRKIREDERDAKANSISRIRDGIFATWSGRGTAITPNAWGLFNATTEYMNFGLPSKKSTNESVLIGDRSKLMDSMALYLNDMVNN